MQDKTTFVSKVKTRWFLVIFVALWALVCLTMIGVLVYGCVGTPSRIDDLLFVWLVLIVAVLVAMNYLKWQISGFENMSFDNESIEIFNSRTWFTKRLRLNYLEAQNIKLDNDKDTPSWIKLWGIGGGKIVIEYLGRHRRFGQDLSQKEARLLFDKISVEFEKRQAKAKTK